MATMIPVPADATNEDVRSHLEAGGVIGYRTPLRVWTAKASNMASFDAAGRNLFNREGKGWRVYETGRRTVYLLSGQLHWSKGGVS